MRAKELQLEDLTASLRDHIKMLESLKHGDAEIVEMLDRSLSRLFLDIDSRRICADDAEIDELNALFDMLGKKGRAKAQKLNLVYSQPAIVLKRSRGGIKIGVFSAETKFAERPSTQRAVAERSKVDVPLSVIRTETAAPKTDISFKSTFEWRLVEKEVAKFTEREIGKGDLTTQGKRVEMVEKVVNELLEKYLPKENSYHNKAHTKGVYDAAKLLSRVAELDRHETELVLVAALFHDTGFAVQYSKNEPVGAEIAGVVMAKMGYSNEDIETVKRVIINGTTFDAATATQPLAKTKLEKILADADLAHLGGDYSHFQETGKNLRKELESRGVKFADNQWDKGQVAILRHSYLTEEASVVGLVGGQKRNLKMTEDNLQGMEA